MKRFLISIVLCTHIIISGNSSALWAQEAQQTVLSGEAIHTPIVGRYGMVTSQEQLASEVGAQILENGGNAVDAAVAVGFALAVVRPQAGNIGGGGFMLIYLAEEDKTLAIDYREMAPLAADRDMFLDEAGNVIRGKSLFTHQSSGVPGTVAGFYHAQQKYGKMAWESVVQPAIDLAENGFSMSYSLVTSIQNLRSRFVSDEDTMALFYQPDGSNFEMGHVFKQPDLARTLRIIAEEGADGFYKGEVAQLIVAEMEANDGIITLEDLATYEVIEREAVEGTYRGLKVVAMPPPSSGGIHIIQILNILENFDLTSMGYGSANATHVIAEAMRRAYADRSMHLGDPDFYDVPTAWLLDKNYAAELAHQIDLDHATPSSEVKPGTPPAHESMDTTHYSIADNEGNVVANTYTINFSFGSGKVVKGAGFLLNDEMDDFSAKVGVPNGFGLLGNDANAIEARKRPLSSMSPAIVFKDGMPWIVSGGRGGSRIITATLQVILNSIDYGMNIAEATHVPRLHHQWFPDRLELDSGYSPDTIALLQAKGHQLAAPPFLASTASIMIENGYFFGTIDSRAPNGAAVAPQHN